MQQQQKNMQQSNIAENVNRIIIVSLFFVIKKGLICWNHCILCNFEDAASNFWNLKILWFWIFLIRFLLISSLRTTLFFNNSLAEFKNSLFIRSKISFKTHLKKCHSPNTTLSPCKLSVFLKINLFHTNFTQYKGESAVCKKK